MQQLLAAEGYSYPQLKPLVRRALDVNVSVLIRGHPGVGKSTLAHELGREMGLPVIDIRLAQKDPAELGGVYVPNREKRCLELYPPEWVVRASEEPHLVFLDEINAAVTRLHQAAAYQIILEHRIGDVVFHQETRVVAAGNLEEDQALAVPLSSALKNRFVHFVLKVDADAWITWAIREGLSPGIVSYIAFAREAGLYRNTGEYAFPTPRSWAMAARVDGEGLPELTRKRLIAGCVGQAAAEEWATFHRVYRQVDVEAILARGEVPDLTQAATAEPSFLYALTFAVGSLIRSRGLKKAAHPHLLKLLQTQGFGPEFQVLLLKQLQGTPAFRTIATEPIFAPVAKELVELLTKYQE